MEFIHLQLSCANIIEAEKISATLLEKRLVACTKIFPVNSAFLWDNRIEKSGEILLTMDSLKDRFSTIENEIKKIHSYEIFVLTAVEIAYLSEGASRWLKSALLP